MGVVSTVSRVQTVGFWVETNCLTTIAFCLKMCGYFQSFTLIVLLGRFPFLRYCRPQRTLKARAYIFHATTLQIPAAGELSDSDPWSGPIWQLSNFPRFQSANWSRRNEWLWSMSRAIIDRSSSENSCVPFKNWLVGPDSGPGKWNATLIVC